jgi:hypothetical protein
MLCDLIAVQLDGDGHDAKRVRRLLKTAVISQLGCRRSSRGLIRILEPPQDDAHVLRHRRGHGAALERRRMQVERNDFRQRIPQLRSREAQHRIPVALIGHQGYGADFRVQSGGKLAAARLLRGEPLSRPGAGK